ncbi:uncharacterized protein [Procambarus clarkii]|uniref:uncharacterized protein n=1 Tax=Procambarus clarkii TaxID=6728 RepID=UPI003743199C
MRYPWPPLRATCIEYVVPDDKLFGSQLANGSWTGLMGLLTRGEVDMTGTVMSQSEERFLAIDFSTPLYMDESKLICKRPIFQSDITGFLKPFTVMTWMVLMVTVVDVTAATASVLQGRSNLFKDRQVVGNFSSVIEQLVKSRYCRTCEGSSGSGVEVRATSKCESALSRAWTSCLWITTPLLGQSFERLPRGDSVRVVVGIWLLLTLIVGTVYRSNLNAMLALPKLHLPFNNLEELVDKGIPCFINRGTMVHQFIEPGKRRLKSGKDKGMASQAPLEEKRLQDKCGQKFRLLSEAEPDLRHTKTTRLTDDIAATVSVVALISATAAAAAAAAAGAAAVAAAAAAAAATAAAAAAAVTTIAVPLPARAMKAEPGSTLYRFKKQAVIHSDVPRAIRDVLQHNHAAFGTMSGILYIIHNTFAMTKTCPYYLAKETYYASTSVSLAFPKNSTLRHKIDPLIQRLQEFGILNYQLMKGLQHARNCLKSDTSTSATFTLRPLELGDFYGALCIYSGGNSIAAIFGVWRVYGSHFWAFVWRTDCRLLKGENRRKRHKKEEKRYRRVKRGVKKRDKVTEKRREETR